MIKNGLNDSWVSPSHKWALSQRATRIYQSPIFKQKFDSFLKYLSVLVASEPKCVTITGCALPRLNYK